MDDGVNLCMSRGHYTVYHLIDEGIEEKSAIKNFKDWCTKNGSPIIERDHEILNSLYTKYDEKCNKIITQHDR